MLWVKELLLTLRLVPGTGLAHFAGQCDGESTASSRQFHGKPRSLKGCSMRVLLLGASGFIGSRLARALKLKGHQVVCAVRGHPPAHACARHAEVDLARDHDPAMWRERLRGIDIVVNVVGIFREGPGQHFDDLHVRGPAALYRACAEMGIERAIQLSALGADERADTAYHLSKQRADEELLARLPNAVVVQPSLVFGMGGASANWFTMLASLSCTPVPAGSQWIQPVHVDDVVEALVRLVESPDLARGHRVVLAGPSPLSLREYLTELRAALGLSRGCFLPVPLFLMRCAARLGSRLGVLWLNESSWRMLRRGNTGDVTVFADLLGRPPRPVSDFIAPQERAGWLAFARLAWLKPLLRFSLAVVWVVSGVVSLWAFPVADSLMLLHRTGVPEPFAPAMLWGAAGLDIALGVATLSWPRRRLWAAQAWLILFYTVVITLRLPEFWAHPYGPVLKNLPMLAILCFLHAFEERP
jgi:uncharacterized protein YbjT (DUF2867 family)